MDRDRLCVRPGCAEGALATLTFDYASRTAWVDDLSREPHPSTYDLCPPHADGLTVPRGWVREDRRSQAPLPFPHSLAV